MSEHTDAYMVFWNGRYGRQYLVGAEATLPVGAQTPTDPLPRTPHRPSPKTPQRRVSSDVLLARARTAGQGPRRDHRRQSMPSAYHAWRPSLGAPAAAAAAAAAAAGAAR